MELREYGKFLRAAAAESGKTLPGYLADVLTGPLHGRCTLLAVCPNSITVARAALAAAAEVGAPAIFAATLNQIDRDGGYTGFTPASFIAFLRAEANRINFSQPVIPCLDHGGPWLKDAHVSSRLNLAEATDEVKKSLSACIDAGYELLHIDATVDRTLGEGERVSIDVVAERTLALIEHAERHRKSTGAAPISYEVGTEEVHGGLADVQVFRRFLDRIGEGLASRGMTDAWPVFIVGRVGTDLRTTEFDPAVARELTSFVRPFGSLIKGHYTDFVLNPDEYPLSGMGGANVGPEFSQVEYEALRDLSAFEKKIGKSSGLDDAIDHAVEVSGRWRKWLTAGERGIEFHDLKPERRQWLLQTGSRYVWTVPEVQHARARLYDNVSDYRNADAYVLWRIKTAILRYYHAFNMVGFCGRVARDSGAS